MIELFFGIWDAIILISMWGTIIAAAGILLYKVYLVIKNKANGNPEKIQSVFPGLWGWNFCIRITKEKTRYIKIVSFNKVS